MISPTFTPNSKKPAIQPIKHPLPKPVVPILHFNGEEDNFTRSRIDNDIYKLFLKAPKDELHVHQGGSSSVEFLSYRLRDAIDEGKIDKLPRYLPDGTYIDVHFKNLETGQPLPADQLLDAKKQVLTIDNLREYYRYQLQSDNQRPYMPIEDIAETTATQIPRDDTISVINRELGLQAYRQTSSRINPYVKNNPAAYLIANEYAKSLAFENVRYTEYRVSPSGNGIGGNNGSNIGDVLASVYDGFEDARKYLKQRNYPLDYGLLVLFERQNRSSQEAPDAKIQRAVELAKQVVDLKKQGKYNIVGVDLAGDEANNPVTEFKPAFDIIKDYNATVPPAKRLGITIHAGETEHSRDLQGFESIAQAINLASDANTPVRIGHGLQIINSSPELRQAFQTYLEHPTDWERRINKKALMKPGSLLDTVIKNKVVLEMCPKSNLQTYGIHPGFPGNQFEVKRSQYSAEAYKRHPAVFLSRLGVKVAISSDNRTISNTDVTNEYVKLFKYAGLTYQDFKRMVLNGFEGAFVADPQKRKVIMADVEKEFKKLERHPERIKAIKKMHGKLTMSQRWILCNNAIRQALDCIFSTLTNWINTVRSWFSKKPSQPVSLT
jgi:adenosine deaminase